MLKNKIALVTGAAGGIGQAMVRELAAHGAIVAAADINVEGLEQLATEMKHQGAKVMAVEVDCLQVDSINAMFDSVISQFGGIDIVINNAGKTRAAYVTDLAEDDWEQIVGVNAKGVFFCLQAAARHMIRQGTGGRIINIASISGRGYARASSVIYAASKGAVISMTKTAAQQLARHDINVNAICPGVTLTNQLSGILKSRAEERNVSPDDILAESASAIPLGRLNDPEDIAAMAIFMASPGARNITGQCYNVDGGLVLN
jgi:NAD(P)-dependent dehydrogenase (short-subunit alcohol dehydrogenase family)